MIFWAITSALKGLASPKRPCIISLNVQSGFMSKGRGNLVVPPGLGSTYSAGQDGCSRGCALGVTARPHIGSVYQLSLIITGLLYSVLSLYISSFGSTQDRTIRLNRNNSDLRALSASGAPARGALVGSTVFSTYLVEMI